MEWGQQMRRHEHVNRDATFHNTNYMNEREKRIPLTILIDGTALTDHNTKFTVNLIEPIIIDELSDIYLDSCMTLNCNFGADKNDMGIAVKIDQFQINTRSNDPVINNSLLIPNEYNDLNKMGEMHLHKGKKMNYVCSINPTKLKQLTGTITNLNSAPAFALKLHRVTLNAGVSKVIPAGTSITISAHGSFAATVAVTMENGATDLYFYETVNGSAVHNGTLAYVFTGLSVTGTATVNTHIPGVDPKMILELLIVNRSK